MGFDVRVVSILSGGRSVELARSVDQDAQRPRALIAQLADGRVSPQTLHVALDTTRRSKRGPDVRTKLTDPAVDRLNAAFLESNASARLHGDAEL